MSCQFFLRMLTVFVVASGSTVVASAEDRKPEPGDANAEKI